MAQNCPLCGWELTRETEYLANTICEQSQTCLNCKCYTYTFSYGVVEYIIGHQAIVSSYTASMDEWNDFYNELKSLLISHQISCHYCSSLRTYFLCPNCEAKACTTTLTN